MNDAIAPARNQSDSQGSPDQVMIVLCLLKSVQIFPEIRSNRIKSRFTL